MTAVLDVQQARGVHWAAKHGNGPFGGDLAGGFRFHPAMVPQEKLAVQGFLAGYPLISPHEKLAGMSIHEAIKALRTAAGLSHKALADRVNALQPMAKPISRQTVQHWEKDTAPKRTRLPAVASALGTTSAKLLETTVDIDLSRPRRGPPVEDLMPLLANIQRFDPSRYEQLAKNIVALDESSRSAQELLSTEFGANVEQAEETHTFAQAPRRRNGAPQDTGPVGMSGFDELHEQPEPRRKRKKQ